MRGGGPARGPCAGGRRVPWRSAARPGPSPPQPAPAGAGSPAPPPSGGRVGGGLRRRCLVVLSTSSGMPGWPSGSWSLNTSSALARAGGLRIP